jgi:hypothetical protein
MPTFDLKVVVLLFTIVINNWIGFCAFMYINFIFYSIHNCKLLRIGNICKLHTAGLSFPFSPGSLHSFILNKDSIPVIGIPGCFLSVFPMPNPALLLLRHTPDGFFLFRAGDPGVTSVTGKNSRVSLRLPYKYAVLRGSNEDRKACSSLKFN